MIISKNWINLEGFLKPAEIFSADVRKFFLISALLLNISLSILGAFKYLGNFVYYFCFCFVSLLLIVFGISQRSISFFFLSVFIWLGFWAKNMAHIVGSYPYQEPIGDFKFLESQVNEVYLVAIMGMVGTLAAGVLINSSFRFNYRIGRPIKLFLDPNRRMKWTFVVLLGFAGLFLNEHFDILHVGTALQDFKIPPKLGAINIWWLSAGLPLACIHLLFLDTLYGFGQKVGFFWICVLGFLASISILSRAIFVFSLGPLLIFYINYVNLSVKKVILIFVISFPLIVFSVSVIQFRRYSANEDISILKSINKGTEVAVSLLVDRWIGLEGLMAVTSYPSKSFSRLFTQILAKRTRGELDFYTNEVAMPNISNDERAYRASVSYATLPGFYGFLYLSGSNLAVLILSFLATCGLFGIELCLLKIRVNPILIFFYSFNLSYGVASIGVDVSRWILFCSISFVFIVILTKFFSGSTNLEVKDKG